MLSYVGTMVLLLGRSRGHSLSWRMGVPPAAFGEAVMGLFLQVICRNGRQNSIRVCRVSNQVRRCRRVLGCGSWQGCAKLTLSSFMMMTAKGMMLRREA